MSEGQNYPGAFFTQQVEAGFLCLLSVEHIKALRNPTEKTTI